MSTTLNIPPILIGSGSSYSLLDNDAMTPFEFGSIVYQCASAAHIAQRFYYNKDRFAQLNAKEAYALFVTQYTERPQESFNRDVMIRHVLRAKFGQHSEAKAQLLSTGQSYLIYHSQYKDLDPDWTDDQDGSGKNLLGKFLMDERAICGGYGEVSLPKQSPPSPQFFLGKSKAAILEEIDTLNKEIDLDIYRKHSQTARDPKNQLLNRFPDANSPYDNTLVPLDSGHYINASFLFEKRFIGTQSPLPETTEDFWKMALEHKVSTIVMLNRIGDHGDHIYFPQSISQPVTYGAVTLKLTEEAQLITDSTWRQTSLEEQAHGFILRHIEVSAECHPPLIIDHFQFINWPDFYFASRRAVAEMVRRVAQIHRRDPDRPIVTHCHAGIGRAGTLMTILDEYFRLDEGNIDIQKSVASQRSPDTGRCPTMVQNPDQYLFCYQVLQELSSE